jgi:hypothetical protein
MERSMFDTTVPLVGQPAEVYECVMLVTAKCKCQSDNAPFVLIGLNPTMCNTCGKVYGIVKAGFDLQRRIPPQAAIGIIGQAVKKDDHGGRDEQSALVSDRQA